MEITSGQSYSNLSNTYTSTTSSSIIPSGLSNYLTNTSTNVKKAVSAMKSLCNETDSSKLKDDTEKFVKYYNKIINDNNLYNDEGLRKLSKKMKSIISEKSSTLSDFGITIQSNGKLKADTSELETSVSGDDFNEFITTNKEKDGMFYKLQKLLTNLKKDNTYYLSDEAKNIINTVKGGTTSSSNTSTVTESTNSTSTTQGTIIDTQV